MVKTAVFRAGAWVRAAATGLALVLVLSSVWALDAASKYKGRPQLSAYDRDWDDLSDLRRAIEESGIPTTCTAATPNVLGRLEAGTEAVMLVLGVEREYTSREMEALVRFVKDDGGTLVVADDFGFGDSIAGRFGLHFSRVPVRTFGPDVGGRIVPTQVRSSPATGADVYSVLLNDASFLQADRWTGIDVLAWSPETSWIDYDGDVRKDPEEPITSVPLVARVHAGYGWAYFISDPSMFINGMIHERQNMAFALNLLAPIAHMPDRLVVFDESRHTPEAAGEVMQRAIYAVTEDALTQTWAPLYTAIAMGAIVAIGVIVARPPRRMRHHDALEDPDTVVLDPAYGRFHTYYRLRAIILERTRVRYHMSPWDYYTAYIGSLPEDLSEWGLRSYIEERPLDTTGLESMEREVRTEYGTFSRPRVEWVGGEGPARPPRGPDEGGGG